MNIQQILDYRNKCLICQSDMTYRLGTMDLPVETAPVINSSEDGLQFGSGHKHGIKLLIKPDGTYSRGDKWYPFYKRNDLTVHKYCLKCKDTFNGNVVILKGRSVGASTAFANSTLNNIKTKYCGYSFNINLLNNKYKISLSEERIKYCDEESFWHINTKFDSKSQLHHSKFAGSLANLLSLNLPPINLSNTKELDQFLNKCKTYILFS